MQLGIFVQENTANESNTGLFLIGRPHQWVGAVARPGEGGQSSQVTAPQAPPGGDWVQLESVWAGNRNSRPSAGEGVTCNLGIRAAVQPPRQLCRVGHFSEVILGDVVRGSTSPSPLPPPLRALLACWSGRGGRSPTSGCWFPLMKVRVSQTHTWLMRGQELQP